MNYLVNVLEQLEYLVLKIEMDRYCRDTNTIHQFRGFFITDAYFDTSRVCLHHTELASM